MAKEQSIQDIFLKQLHKENMAISIFLVNGIKLHGVIDSYDDHVILLKNAVTQMVFKHAISTVVPAQMINISEK